MRLSQLPNTSVTRCRFDRLIAISIDTGGLAGVPLYALEKAAEIADTERIVAIFARDQYVYRLALIYMLFIEQAGWEVWTFRDRAEAVAWLRSVLRSNRGSR